MFSKGLNFAVALERGSIEDMICAIELLSKDDADQIRLKTSKLPRTVMTYNSRTENITKKSFIQITFLVSPVLSAIFMECFESITLASTTQTLAIASLRTRYFCDLSTWRRNGVGDTLRFFS